MKITFNFLEFSVHTIQDKTWREGRERENQQCSKYFL